MTASDPSARFDLAFDAPTGRRIIAGKNVILHCHHYNSRVQRTVESAAAIDGKAILVSTAEAVFGEWLRDVFQSNDDTATRRAVAEGLYAHLGYGRIDLSTIEDGRVVAPASHFVQGWRAGFPDRGEPVCSFAEGYLQGAVHAVTGETFDVREVECAAQGAEQCVFELERVSREPARRQVGTRVAAPVDKGEFLRSPNVDEQKIVETLVAMPIVGNDDGLIPAFNVYLASTPADFYNEVALRFIDEMEEQGLGEIARDQLIRDAETCGMNTFRGIMSSPEWDALVGPMLKAPEDTMFGVVAVSNGLGWGDWQIRRYEPQQRLELFTSNGYEANGELEGADLDEPSCLMLTGVSAGIMQLVHGVGSFDERYGQYLATESCCRSVDGASCVFEVGQAA